MNALAIQTVTAEVSRVGYCRLREMSSETFRAIVEQLGVPGFETEVRLRPDVGSYLTRTAPVPLHTDHFEASLIAWRCEAQDPHDGAMLLVDGAAAIKEAAEGERAEAISGVRFHSRPSPGTAGACVPLARYEGARARVFYAPWLEPEPLGPDESMALARFREVLARHEQEKAIEVRLEPGEVLIVDNGRMIHGRRALVEDSRRLLRRFWIRTK